MTLRIARVIQSTVAVAVLETVVNAFPFRPFYPAAVGIYLLLETLFYFIIISIAALMAIRIPLGLARTRKFLFFALVLAPSLFSSYFFYREVSFYWQGGQSLVTDGRVTMAGFEHILVNIAIAALLAALATVIYFRSSVK